MAIEFKGLLVVVIRLFFRYIVPRVLDILSRYDDDEIKIAVKKLKTGIDPSPPV